ncbi:hypothetical protein HY229_03790 [Candidatus Acetothermia bacterium]|nr:hypothetical protein [Candidatus Acetothermia bacterium]MBI3643205.1 hypothetical protein [Candidatus Acetothermia bacterium]
MDESKSDIELLKSRAELARLAYGEQIIRCTNREPEEMEGFLMLDGNEEMGRWWRAFAIAKREGHPDFIRGLVTYMISNYLGDSDRLKQKILVQQIRLGKVRFDNLTCEILSGTRLRWRHVFLLVGKEFNPTRERELVKQIYIRLRSAEESVKNS